MADIRDTFITQPSGKVRLGDLLKQLLTDDKWSHFSAAVAFVKRSGVQHIADALLTFSERGSIRMLIGVDLGGTSWEGLSDLLTCVGESGEIWVCHNETSSTFHPKVYIFRNETQAIVIVGSGNLTEGGLFTNYEASMMRVLNLAEKEDRKFLAEIDAALEEWLSPKSGFSRKLTPEFLEEIYQHGYVVDDSSALGEEKTAEEGRKGAVKGGFSGLFAKVKVPRAPSVHKSTKRTKVSSKELHKPVSALQAGGKRNAFLMTLQQTDCGVGQMTAGASRRSPEVFIPLSARKHNPDFWGWPDEFEEDPKKKGKHDRRNVPMELGGRIIHVNMMTWPAKHDFRLRSEALRSAGSIGDILKIEKSDDKEVKYRVKVIKQHSQGYSKHLRLCSNRTPNSKKRWGYL